MIYLCKTIKPLLALTLVLLSLPCLATNSAGELELRADTGKRHTALLLDTAISGEVNGMLANITVTQTFKNDSDRWLNGRYVFPLPPGAAVDSLTIEIGERVIEGIIKEKEDAKRTFEQAQRQGKKAGLLQQHRPNLFSIAIANIGPFEEIVSKITFIDQVDFEDDTFSLSLPTTLTPRYIPNASATLSKQQQKQLEHDLRSEADVDINSSHGWAANNDRIDDANNIAPPQAHGFVSQTSHRFSLDLSLKVGLDLQHIASPSHPVSANFNSDDVQVSLANGLELMNRDLILEWQPVLGTAPKAALFQQASESKSEFYTMMMLTPPKTNASVSLPRDVTFIVDSSGSMAGQPMRQAKQALHDGLQYLNAGDRFNIVDFDSQYRTLYSQSQEANFDHLENAKQMINNLAADGGTEMAGALRFALTSKQDSNYLRQVIFITDGAISNESELFKLINQHLGDTRLFTVGIGSAPNAFFMSKAAKYGRGSYTFIRDLNQVQRKIATLFEKINKPVLRDLKIKWPTAVEQYPKYLPDLYAGQPLTVLVKSSSPIDTVEVTGSMLNTPWTKTLTMDKSDQLKSKSIDTVWARQKIAYLMDKLYTGEQAREQIKPLIIALGIKHQLLTKFTAFVAVEKTPSKPEFAKAKQHAVPNIMPEGSTMSVPQTATPASVLNLLGVLMVLLSLVIKRLFSRKPSTALSILSRVRSQRSAEV